MDTNTQIDNLQAQINVLQRFKDKIMLIWTYLCVFAVFYSIYKILGYIHYQSNPAIDSGW